VVRSNGADWFCFLLNLTPNPQTVTFREPAFDLLEGQKLKGQSKIQALGARRGHTSNSMRERILWYLSRNRTERLSDAPI
jgi:glycosyl hydrolase family 42 (putative beta-galactosidase)